jgi:GGDEF domain-containing protein
MPKRCADNRNVATVALLARRRQGHAHVGGATDETSRIAEKIRCRAAEPIHHDGNTIQATLSIGATVSVPGESARAVTARADVAMYRAKQARRNTAVWI